MQYNLKKVNKIKNISTTALAVSLGLCGCVNNSDNVGMEHNNKEEENKEEKEKEVFIPTYYYTTRHPKKNYSINDTEKIFNYLGTNEKAYLNIGLNIANSIDKDLEINSTKIFSEIISNFLGKLIPEIENIDCAMKSFSLIDLMTIRKQPNLLKELSLLDLIKLHKSYNKKARNREYGIFGKNDNRYILYFQSSMSDINNEIENRCESYNNYFEIMADLLMNEEPSLIKFLNLTIPTTDPRNDVLLSEDDKIKAKENWLVVKFFRDYNLYDDQILYRDLLEVLRSDLRTTYSNYCDSAEKKLYSENIIKLLQTIIGKYNEDNSSKEHLSIPKKSLNIINNLVLEALTTIDSELMKKIGEELVEKEKLEDKIVKPKKEESEKKNPNLKSKRPDNYFRK